VPGVADRVRAETVTPRGSGSPAPPARLRKFPHPYRAMLAISTAAYRATLPSLRALHRFLNTRERTPLGRGLGLDVAGAMWVDKQTESEVGLRYARSFGDRRAAEADELAHYARAGWIDTLGSYGNFTNPEAPVFERRDALAALAELRDRGITLRAWVNHGGASNTQNLGRATMQADLPGSPAYHTDLLLESGMRYAWNHEGAGRFGADTLLSPLPLRDGRRLWGFRRYSAESGPLAAEIAERHGLKLMHAAGGEARCLTWWPELLPYQLAEDKLDGLVAREQYCVIAQHLGAAGGPGGFGPEAIAALRRLRDYHEAGKVLVARSSRVLEYNRVVEHLEYELRSSGRLDIDIVAVRDPVIGTFVPTLDQLRGVTFYVEDPDATFLHVNGRPIARRDLVRSPSDGTSPSIGVAWFRRELTDHAAAFAEGR
jgi:hypothetical protein